MIPSGTACHQDCKGDDSESHCVITNSPYCALTNPPEPAAGAALADLAKELQRVAAVTGQPVGKLVRELDEMTKGDAPIIEYQLCDLLEGLGASEDHQDAIVFFTKDGISEVAAKRLVAALALHRFVPADVLTTWGVKATPFGWVSCQHGEWKFVPTSEGEPEDEAYKWKPVFVHVQRQCGGCGLTLSACICELEKLPSGMIQPTKPWPRASGVQPPEGKSHE